MERGVDARELGRIFLSFSASISINRYVVRFFGSASLGL